jgi:hypothetical protein
MFSNNKTSGRKIGRLRRTGDLRPLNLIKRKLGNFDMVNLTDAIACNQLLWAQSVISTLPGCLSTSHLSPHKKQSPYNHTFFQHGLLEQWFDSDRDQCLFISNFCLPVRSNLMGWVWVILGAKIDVELKSASHFQKTDQ